MSATNPRSWWQRARSLCQTWGLRRKSEIDRGNHSSFSHPSETGSLRDEEEVSWEMVPLLSTGATSNMEENIHSSLENASLIHLVGLLGGKSSSMLLFSGLLSLARNEINQQSYARSAPVCLRLIARYQGSLVGDYRSANRGGCRELGRKTRSPRSRFSCNS